MKPTVYLAGPITGTSYQGCTDWREAARRELADVGIVGLSPMRGKEYLSHIKEFTMDGDKYKPFSIMSSNRGIMTRDRWDATRCDVLLVNFIDAPRVSIGTCMEIAWADLARIPVVAVMEADGSNKHEHGMILEAIGYKCATLDEALRCIKIMLVAQ